jgi:hypothetical protein
MFSLLIYRSSDGFRAGAAACAAPRRALSGLCFLGASVTPWQKWLQATARLRDISGLRAFVVDKSLDAILK